MDLILLIFLCWQIGKTAEKKGLKAGLWRWRLVGIWLLFELIGFYIGAGLFGLTQDNFKEKFWGISLFSLAFAFGGYLLVKRNLDKRPDPMDNDIDNIGDT